MEVFKKNWFLILLIAVIFASLGFLFGKNCGACKRGNAACSKNKKCTSKHDKCKEVGSLESGNYEVEVKIDTITNENGEIEIRKEVRKIKKGNNFEGDNSLETEEEAISEEAQDEIPSEEEVKEE